MPVPKFLNDYAVRDEYPALDVGLKKFMVLMPAIFLEGKIPEFKESL